MSETDRARERQKRFGLLNFSAGIREDDPAMQPMIDFVRQKMKTAEGKKQSRDFHRRATAVAAAQRLNGPGLYVDSYLRDFLQEYNGRIFRGEGRSMPNSFNVMSAFVEPDEKAMVLRLLPEKFITMSFHSLLDHVTSPEVDTKLEFVGKSLENLTIYEINMLGGYAQFQVPDAEEYIFCGSAFCREGDEISIVGIFGKSGRDRTERKDKINREMIYPGKEFLFEGVDDVDMTDETLFGDEDYVPIILMMRVDIAQDKVQVRYVLDEKKGTFNIITDDPQIVYDLNVLNKNGDQFFADFVKRMDVYSPLFNLLLSVPSCMNLADSDDVVLERHPTKLRQRSIGREGRLIATLPQFEAPKYVTVATLYDLGKIEAGYNLPPAGLTMETSGYWKILPMGTEGRDRFNNPVQGKTWVTSQISWYEKSPPQFDSDGSRIEIPPLEAGDVGEIYVLRNAVHPRDVFKIGFTTKNADERARQLGATSGQPDVFNVVEAWHVKSPRTVEYQVHELLKDYRVNFGREFFKVKYQKIHEVVEKVIDLLKARID